MGEGGDTRTGSEAERPILTEGGGKCCHIFSHVKEELHQLTTHNSSYRNNLNQIAIKLHSIHHVKNKENDMHRLVNR